MTDLHFGGAGATAVLTGVDHLPVGVSRLVVDVGGPLLLRSVKRTERARLVLDRVGSTVRLDGIALPESAVRAAALVLGAVDRALLDSTACLLVHAGAISGPGGVAIVPGRSGSGKSTLVAAAMQQGLALVSDEAACLAPEDHLIWPHPRPLGLSGRSRALLDLPAPELGPEDTEPEDTERWMAPSLLGRTAGPAIPLVPRLLLVSTRVASHESCGITPADRSEVIARLLANLLNTRGLSGSGGPAGQGWTAERAWWRIGRLVENTSSARLTYHSPSCGGSLLRDALGGASGVGDVSLGHGASH